MNPDFSNAVLHITAWKHRKLVRVQRALLAVALEKTEFSSDDLPEDLLDAKDRNTIGAAFGALRHEGLIEACRFAPSQKKSRHGNPVRIWRLSSLGKAQSWLQANREAVIAQEPVHLNYTQAEMSLS